MVFQRYRIMIYRIYYPLKSEDRRVFGVRCIPVAILPSCQDMKTIAVQLHKHKYSWIVALLPFGFHTDRSPMDLGQFKGLGEYCGPNTASSVFLILYYYSKGITS